MGSQAKRSHIHNNWRKQLCRTPIERGELSHGYAGKEPDPKRAMVCFDDARPVSSAKCVSRCQLRRTTCSPSQGSYVTLRGALDIF
jgi:hypothetical protein